MTSRRIAALIVVAVSIVAGLVAQSGPFQMGGTSPRIQAFETAFAQRGAPAVAEFWAEVARVHAPLIEPVAGQADRVRVTFLYRSTPAVASVRVLSFPMTRVPGTDVWFATMTMNKDHRVWYRIETTTSSGASTSGPDLLNPLRVRSPQQRPVSAPTNMPAIIDSSFVMADAPHSPWLDEQPGVARGRVTEAAVPSRVHGSPRRVWVYEPSGSSASAGLLVCLWGGDYLGPIPVPTVLDNLIAAKRLPPIVAIFVDDTGDRFQDFQATERFSAFIAGDLMPWARGRVVAARDPHRVIVAGYSAGGLESAYLGFAHATLIGNVLSQSGAYWRAFEGQGAAAPEWLAGQISAAPKLDLRFFLDVGMEENGREIAGGPTFLEANRHMRDTLEARGYAMKYHEVPGGEHAFLNWRETFVEGLLFLTQGW